MRRIGTVGPRPATYVYRGPKIERDGYLKLYSYEVGGLRHRQEMMDRGDAVVVLPVDEARRVLYLIRQPRYLKALVERPEGRRFLETAGIMANGWRTLKVPRGAVDLWESPAGMIDPGEDPLAAAVRELREETGLDVPPDRFVRVGTRYPSVGAVGERMFLYIARLSDSVIHAAPRGDGDEHIEVWEMTYDEAFGLLERGEIESLSSSYLLTALENRALKGAI